MFRTSSCPSSGAYQLQEPPLVYRWNVVVAARPRPTTLLPLRSTGKPEAAPAVDKLLMMGMKMPETCWTVFKRQAIKVRDRCIWLVDLFEYSVFMFLDSRPKQDKTSNVGKLFEPLEMFKTHREWSQKREENVNVERVKIVAWHFDLSSSDRALFSWVNRTIQQNGAVPYVIRYLVHVVQVLNWHSSMAAGMLYGDVWQISRTFTI